MTRDIEWRGARALALIVLATLFGGACAKTQVTWRAADRYAPLPEDAPIELFVRKSAPDDLREAMLDRGAQLVAAFPPGERVAEFSTVSAAWTDFDFVLDDVRAGARAMGADLAVATSSETSIAGEIRFLFQLLHADRTLDADHFAD